MPTLSKYKNILLPIVLACVLYLGYTYLAPSGDIGTLESTPANASELEVNKQYIELLEYSKGIQFDATFFDSAAYKSLEETKNDIAKQPIGRSNPFAPIGK